MDDLPAFDDEPEHLVPPAEEQSPFDDHEGWVYEGEDATPAAPAPGASAGVRRESLRQRENFASTGQFTLHEGPKVRVTGRTLLIHGKTKKPRVKLQLAKERRTKHVFPAWETADGRIALEGDEVEDLYARLTEARENLGERTEADYLVVRTGANPEITGLEALLRMVAENPESFVPLTMMVGAEQLNALHAVANVGRFQRARQELDDLIKENPPESAFQRWFEENDWVFGTEYVERLRKGSRHISPDSVIDLILLAVDGFADIFELKRPGADVFVQPSGRTFLIPSADLNAAFGQAVHYLADADNMGFFNQAVRGVPFYRPRVRLVIGRSAKWTDAHYRAYRETMTAWNRIELLTYDMVLRRIDQLIRTMSRELREKATAPEEAPEEASYGPDDAFASDNDGPADLDDLPF